MRGEEEILDFWENHQTFEKSVNQRPIEKQYVFYDGPPFATGLPHYGHILSFTVKDLFPRYWTMKNYRVERKWGWDCHGLPIENICEQQLAIKHKKDIIEMGVDEFNEYCRSKVLWYTKEWKRTVRRMGKWIEFDNAYKTMDTTYMETIWYIFKKIYEEGYVYKGKKILLYCPRCETPLSNFEIQMDNSYHNITESAVIAKFKLKKETNTYVLAWTTTPWTLVGNVALAVNLKLAYVRVKVRDEYYILIKNGLRLFKEYDSVEEIKGKELVNKEYEPLYYISTEKKSYYIVDGGDNVVEEEGTGIVHLAIYGEFDYEMIKKYDLPVIQHIDEHGKLILGPKNWIGNWFKDVDFEVTEDLRRRNLLYMEYDYTHSYPFCYRCDTPLIYNALDAWFIDIQRIKPKLIETNKEINWYPKHIANRYNYILNNAPDWCMSRNRFWATAIPIWICNECNHITVIGSIAELKEKAIEEVPDDLDLHKHIVDKFHLTCKKCQKIMNRIPEVFDCWFESGSMPFASKHYPFENQNYFKTSYPADFISEYVGQVRAWFYYMHVIGILVLDKIPFKHVVVNGNILAEDGSKMSKSKRNFPDPNLIIKKYGADALSIYLMASPIQRAQDLRFKEENLQTVYRRFILLLFNVLKFYTLFKVENLSIDMSDIENILDKWIISLTNILIRDVTFALDTYDTSKMCKLIFDYVEDLSTWYVRCSRPRFKNADQREVLLSTKTFSYVLLNLSKILAPTTPFMAEMIYQELKERKLCSAESVHLDFWPSFDEKLIFPQIIENMEKVREIVSKALEERDRYLIPIRQVLRKLTISNINLDKEYLNIIASEVNVKKIELREGDELIIELDTEITPELRLEGISRQIIRHLNNYRKKLRLNFGDPIYLYIELKDPEIKESFEKFKDEIKQNIQAVKVYYSVKETENIRELKINNKIVRVFIEILKK